MATRTIKLSDATGPQMRTYARDYLGITFPGTPKDETMRARIAETGATEIKVAGENDGPTPLPPNPTTEETERRENDVGGGGRTPRAPDPATNDDGETAVPTKKAPAGKGKAKATQQARPVARQAAAPRAQAQPQYEEQYEEEYEDEVPPLSAVEVVAGNAAPGEDPQVVRDRIRRDGQYIQVMIARSPADGGDEPVTIVCNGKALRVERGKPQLIRRPFYECLRNSEERHWDMKEENGQIELVPRMVQSYPHSALEMPA